MFFHFFQSKIFLTNFSSDHNTMFIYFQNFSRKACICLIVIECIEVPSVYFCYMLYYSLFIGSEVEP